MSTTVPLHILYMESSAAVADQRVGSMALNNHAAIEYLIYDARPGHGTKPIPVSQYQRLLLRLGDLFTRQGLGYESCGIVVETKLVRTGQPLF